MGKVSEHEKIILNRNLGSMLEAGLPLARALAIIEHQTKNLALKKVMNDIGESIKKGEPLSSAMNHHPKVFNSILISMIQAGEESGKLVESLNVVADQMEKNYNLKNKVKGAMMYPTIILIAMLIIAIFMLTYIVPSLSTTFKDLGAELPAATQFIVDLSDFVKANLVVILISFIILAFLFYFLGKNSKARRFIDWFWLKIPVISQIVREVNSARTTRTLASLLSAGVPYVRSLQIVKEVVQNSFYKEVITKAQKNVELGMPISGVFSEAEKFYPVFVGEMMAVGEETGELGPMLYKVALFYEDEVDQKTKNMSTIIEPFLMIIIGIGVGFFAYTMITPMYSLVQTI
jgi:type IV pilus assembly protein PilC